MSDYQKLILQIEAFVKRFYLNRIVKGSLFFIAVFILVLLFFSGLEFFARFGSIVRALFFFLFFGINVFVFFKFILLPVFRINKLGKHMNHFEAARLIGKLIPSLSDKVLNTLQLEHSPSQQNVALVRAAIEQKSSELNHFSFPSAISIKENTKYLKYVLPLVFIFLLILLLKPAFIGSASNRIFHFNQHFAVPSPFRFVWLNAQSSLEEGKPLLLRFRLEGSQFPDKLFIQSSKGKFLMSQVAKNEFEYSISSLHRDFSFYLQGGEFSSKEYSVQVFGKSNLSSILVSVDYPAYTGLKDEALKNPVLLNVPEGTRLHYSGFSDNVKLYKWIFKDSVFSFQEEEFSFLYPAFHSQTIALKFQNKFSQSWSSEQRFLQVIPDAFPRINIEEKSDSVSNYIRYFKGDIKDDYGIKSLYLVYSIRQEDKVLVQKSISIPDFPKQGGSFYHYFDIAQLGLKPNQVLTYFFKVYDNDGIHGPKFSVSSTFTFKSPSLQELENQRNNSISSSLSGFSDIQKEVSSFEQKLADLHRSNLNQEDLYKQKENIKELQIKQEELEKKLKSIQEKLKKSMEEQALFDKVSPELLEKQKLLNDLLDKVMDKELKNLLDELAKLLNNKNNEQFEKKMDQMKQSNEELNRKLDRAMEMLKKMQLDEKLEQSIDHLKQLSKQQDSIRNQMNKTGISQELKNTQDSINKAFNDISKNLDSIQKLNNSLNQPKNLDLNKELQESIKESLNESKENLNNNNKSKSNKSQSKSSDSMKELSQSLESQKEQEEQEQHAEDMQTIRYLLKNLLLLSFSQEDLFHAAQQFSTNDNFNSHLNVQQLQLSNDYSPIKDSLIALSKRVPKIAKMIDDHLHTIDLNFQLISKLWESSDYRSISSDMMQIVTSYNDLALILNQSLEQMQANMRQNKGGNGSCSKPGGSKPKNSSGESESMSGMKESLKKQLEQLKNGQQGKGQNGNKPGEGALLPGGLSNEQISKMAAEQSAIREALEKLRQELNKEGNGLGNTLNPLIEELKQQEKNLVNKKFDNLINRQQDILTRMLESEKAIKEREFDNKRQSEEGKNTQNSNLIRFLEYKRKKELEIEFLRSKSPFLNQYYRKRADEYFNELMKEND